MSGVADLVRLRALWPRWQTYALPSARDELHAICAAGAAGDEARAAECFERWTERKRAIVAELGVLRDEMLLLPKQLLLKRLMHERLLHEMLPTLMLKKAYAMRVNEQHDRHCPGR